MKKKIILAVVLMACCMSQMNAQVKFGIKGGLNFDKFKFDENTKNKLNLENASGWQAGALLQIKIPVVGIGVQPELLYTVCKTNIDTEPHSIHFFEVPIMLQWGLDLMIVRPYIQGGPYFGYVLKADGPTFDDKIGKNDWGIALGAGIDIWKFQFGARYQWGLQNVSSVTDFELKNNRLNLSLGFRF